MIVIYITYLEPSVTIVSIKSKIMYTITSHPKRAMFGIGVADTFAISMTIGM